MNMVGTPLKQVIRSCVMHDSAALALKYGIGLIVAPCVIDAVMESTMPKQWNIGTWIIMRSAVESPMRSPMHLPSLTTLRCVSMTPLGNPVVPEVYCMLQTSSGTTCAAMRCTSSSGTDSARSKACSMLRQPGMSKPTVMTLRKNGSFLQCSGSPGSLVAISGQSSLMMPS